MNTSTLKKGIVIVLIGLGTMGVNAQKSNRGGDHRTPPTFDELLEKMDKNEDGKLSEKEIKGPLKNDFSKVDTNEDGFITKEELENAPKPNKERRR